MFNFMNIMTLQATFTAEGEGNLPEYQGLPSAVSWATVLGT